MVIVRPIDLNVSCKLHPYSSQRTRSPPRPRLPKRIRNTRPRNYYGSISSGGDYGIHCWWDLIRSKQLSSVSVCRALVFVVFSRHGNSIYPINLLVELSFLILESFVLFLLLKTVSVSCSFPFYHQNLLLLFESFSYKRYMVAPHKSLRDSKFPQVSRTLLSILPDLNTTILWMVSTRSLISSSPCTNPFLTVPRAPITIGITVTFMFHSFFQFSCKV